MQTRNAWMAAGWSFVWTFLGSGLLLLTGWLTDVASWVSSDGLEFPSISPLVKAAVALLIAAVVAAVCLTVRWLQAKNILPGAGPTYQPTPPPEG